jgi:hypothetical protein
MTRQQVLDLYFMENRAKLIDLAAFLDRLARAGELLDVNVAPELLVDSLVLAWPGRARAA